MSDTKDSTKSNRMLLVLIPLLAIAGFFFYSSLQEPADIIIDNEAIDSAEDAEGIKLAVMEHYLLPVDKEPVVATILDIKKLLEKNSVFYSDAKNGDKILVYPDKAIIYSPERDIIVNVAPIFNAGETENSEELSESEEKGTEEREDKSDSDEEDVKETDKVEVVID